jgi:hypothetical protein
LRYNGAPKIMNTSSTRLVHILIGKSIVETLMVGTLAVVAFATVLPPSFHGWGEVADAGISGWAVNDAAPFERVEVQLFVDGEFVAAAVADKYRPDVAEAGWAQDAWHGYTFNVASVPGRHEARIYALHDSGGGLRKSLQLLGAPITFAVDTQGKVSALRLR